MNHQPFETWIFSEDPLQSEDMVQLNDHLQSCEDCRKLSHAMAQLDQTFTTTPAPAPAPGFTQRWQARLAVHRKLRQQRRMWFLTLGFFGLASLLSMLILLLELGQVNWFYEISQFIANFSRWAARVNQVWVFAQSVSETLPIFTPIMIVFGSGLVCVALALIVTWCSSIIQLYQTAK